MPENVTPEKIKEILNANGINSLNDLAIQLAENEESPVGSVLRNAIGNGELESSWVIRVVKLSVSADHILNLDEVPPSILGNSL